MFWKARGQMGCEHMPDLMPSRQLTLPAAQSSIHEQDDRPNSASCHRFPCRRSIYCVCHVRSSLHSHCRESPPRNTSQLCTRGKAALYFSSLYPPIDLIEWPELYFKISQSQPLAATQLRCLFWKLICCSYPGIIKNWKLDDVDMFHPTYQEFDIQFSAVVTCTQTQRRPFLVARVI